MSFRKHVTYICNNCNAGMDEDRYNKSLPVPSCPACSFSDYKYKTAEILYKQLENAKKKEPID